MAKKKDKSLTEEEFLYKITAGSTLHRDRHDPKKIRIRHFQPRYALVEWRGSGYSCNGFYTYVPGWLELHRIPEDVRLSSGTNLWECNRGNSLTKARMAKLIELIDRQPLPLDRDEFHAICRGIREEMKSLRKTE